MNPKLEAGRLRHYWADHLLLPARALFTCSSGTCRCHYCRPSHVGLQLPHRRWWKGNLKHQQFHLRLKVSSRKAHFSGFLLLEHQSIPASLGDTETHQQCWPAGSEHTFKMSSSNNINHNSGMLGPVLSTEKHFLFSHVPLQDRYQHLFLIKENSEAQSS